MSFISFEAEVVIDQAAILKRKTKESNMDGQDGQDKNRNYLINPVHPCSFI